MNSTSTIDNKKSKVNVISEITDREFTILDLVNLNSNVKVPSIRTYVKRNVDAGRYKVVGTVKSGKRGKPSITYVVVSPKNGVVEATL